VNCATACNTGSRRSPDEPPCRGLAHCKTSCTEPHVEETDQVWIEAGFLPRACCRRAVALLHRLAMDEEPTASLLSCILAVAAETSGDPGRARGYNVLDPAQLRRTAEEYGIEPAGRNDDEIARAVTLAIIGEYGDDMPIPVHPEQHR